MNTIIYNQFQQVFKSVLVTVFSCVIVFSTWAQMTPEIQILVNVVQPASPYLPQLQQDITGNNPNVAANSVTQRLNVTIISNSLQMDQNLRLIGSIERLSPSNMSITVSPSYYPPQPFVLPMNQTRMLSSTDLENLFANFNSSYLEYNNFSWQEMKENGMNYKLPEGYYRICVRAYSYDNPGGFVESCAYFNICYQLSAPQFLMPYNTMAQFDTQFEDYYATSNQMQFLWSQPTSTCGLSTAGIDYDFEVRRVFEGQSIQDAIHSIPVYQKSHVFNTSFIFDTLMYPGVFLDNEKYIVRVRANLNNGFNSPISVENDGYSQLMAFTYHRGVQNGTGNGTNSGDDGDISDNTNSSSTGTHPPASTTTDTGDGPIACSGVTAPTNHSNYTESSIKDKEVSIGAFKMTVTESTKSGNSFSGKGYIVWKPYSAPLKLAVSFSNIKVNTDLEVYEGQVLTDVDPNAPQIWTQMVTGTIETMKDIVSTAEQNIIDQIKQIRNQGPNSDISLMTPDPSIAVTFPLGINNFHIGSAANTLAITGIRFTPQGAAMRVLFSMDIPEIGDWISLAGSGFCVYPDHIDLGNGYLYLPGNKKIKLGHNTLAFNSTESGGLDLNKTTYLQLEGGSVKEIGVHAQLKIDSDALVPVDATGKRVSNDSVSLKMDFTFTDWNDWIASLTLDKPFEIAGLDGFKIDISQGGIFYDHSNTKNPDGFVKPTKYEIDGGVNNFQGVYMKQLKLNFPKDFAIKNTGDQSLSLAFNNLIIDENGVTTSIHALNIMKLSTGKLGGWAFSIDTLKLDIVQNAPDETYTMAGQLKLPVSKTPFNYNSILNTGKDAQNTFEFNVKPASEMSFDIMMAKAYIASNSSIGLVVTNSNKVRLKANLNGGLNISLSSGSKSPTSVSIPVLEFQGLRLANYQMEDAPNSGSDNFSYDIESISFAGLALGKKGAPQARNASAGEKNNSENNSKIGGFPISISNFQPVVGMNGSKPKFGIAMDLALQVGFGDAIALGAQAEQFQIYGVINSGSTPEFSGVSVQGISIGGEFGPVTVAGKLMFRNDTKFGEGVEGIAAVKFPPGVELGAYLAFGKRGNLDYFGFATDVDLGTAGIPVGPVIITGFSGGFFKNMEIEKTTGSEVPTMQVSIKNKTYTMASIPRAIPSSQEKIAISAGVHLALISETVFKGYVDLLVELNTSKGLSVDKITISGTGEALTTGGGKGMVTGGITMEYSFSEGYFKMDAILDGNVPIVGTEMHLPIHFYSGNKRDESNPEVSREVYYFYIGVPDDPAKIDLVNIGNDKSAFMLKIGAQAYFCIGNELPEPAELPKEIEDAFIAANLNPSKQPVSGIDGKAKNGFMFGAQIDGFLNLKITPVYFKASTIIGFDMALRQISPTDCGTDAVGSTIGYNNWYATGSFYFYLKAALGIHIDVWFYEDDIEIASMILAAQLKAGLPNPTWGEGRVALKLSLLGGLISINTGVQVEFGDKDKNGKMFKCNPKVDPLAGLEMISEVGPEGEDMRVDTAPYVFFTLPMNDPEKMNSHNTVYMDVNMENSTSTTYKAGVTKRYRLLISEVDVKKGNQVIDPNFYSLTLSDDKQLYTITPSEGWEPETKYTVHIQGKAEQLINNEWRIPEGYESKGGFFKDSTFTFRTGKGPKTINNDNVMYSNPIAGQRYFLKKEYNKRGVIKLNTYISSWFEIDGSQEDVQVKALFIPTSGRSIIKTPIYRDDQNYTLSFQIPSSIQNSTEYKLQVIVEKPSSKQIITIDDKDLRVNGSTGYAVAVTNGYTNNRYNSATASTSNSATSTNFSIPTFSGYTGTTSGTSTMLSNAPIISNVSTNGTIAQNSELANKEGYILKGNKVEVYKSSGVFRVIYETKFRTSKYDTFEEKINSYGQMIATKTGTVHTLPNPTGSGNSTTVQDLKIASSASFCEPFDEIEVYGNTVILSMNQRFTLPPVLSLTLPFNSETSENEKSYMELINKIGLTEVALDVNLSQKETRNEYNKYLYNTNLKMYPTKAVEISSRIKGSILTPSIHPSPVDGKFILNYYGDYVLANDLNLMQKAANKFLSNYNFYVSTAPAKLNAYQQDIDLYHHFDKIYMINGIRVTYNEVDDYIKSVLQWDHFTSTTQGLSSGDYQDLFKKYGERNYILNNSDWKEAFKSKYENVFKKLSNITLSTTLFNNKANFNQAIETVYTRAKQLQNARTLKDTYFALGAKRLAVGADGRTVDIINQNVIVSNKMKDIYSPMNAIKNMNFVATPKGSRNLQYQYGLTTKEYTLGGAKKSLVQDQNYSNRVVNRKYTY